MFRCLFTNLSVRQVFLFNNKLGDEGAEEMAKALHANHHVELLGLGSNSIGTKGARALAGECTHITVVSNFRGTFSQSWVEAADVAAELLRGRGCACSGSCIEEQQHSRED